MREFHTDKTRYFDMQYRVTCEYILPFIDEIKIADAQTRVLEIGCGEAGVLKAFRERGSYCLGIELSEYRTEYARQFHDELDLPGKIEFRNDNIYDIDPANDLDELFDIIILKDVIEHIPGQEKFIPALAGFLKPRGIVFFGFPPWCMPFGGHQQLAQSKLLSKVPYYHLLPRSVYKGVLNLFNEPDRKVNGLMEIYDTRISIQRFERIVRKSGFRIAHQRSWLLNPIYKYKFGKGPIRQSEVVSSVPWLRDFMTTAVYYIITCDEASN